MYLLLLFYSTDIGLLFFLESQQSSRINWEWWIKHLFRSNYLMAIIEKKGGSWEIYCWWMVLHIENFCSKNPQKIILTQCVFKSDLCSDVYVYMWYVCVYTCVIVSLSKLTSINVYLSISVSIYVNAMLYKYIEIEGIQVYSPHQWKIRF